MKYEYEYYTIIRIKELNGDHVKIIQTLEKYCPEVLARAEIIAETKRKERK